MGLLLQLYLGMSHLKRLDNIRKDDYKVFALLPAFSSLSSPFSFRISSSTMLISTGTAI